MRFLTDKLTPAEPPDARPPRRWTRPAAWIAGLSVMVLFVLSALYLFTPDPGRRILDPIDQHMVAGEWQQAADLCRVRLAEQANRPAAAPAASEWRRTTNLQVELPLRLGICLSMQEKYDQAREVLDAALAEHPDQHRLIYNRALVEYRAGRFDDALDRLQALARQAPYFPHVHYHIGRIHESRGLYDRALEAYRDELNISSSAGAWERYMVLKKMRGATTSRPAASQDASRRE